MCVCVCVGGGSLYFSRMVGRFSCKESASAVCHTRLKSTYVTHSGSVRACSIIAKKFYGISALFARLKRIQLNLFPTRLEL